MSKTLFELLALTKETGLWIKETALENRYIKMAINILGIGNRTKEKEKDACMY